MDPSSILVVGGGLAGCEAAWQLTRRGHRVTLCEMKPLRFSPAHQSPHLAELVCSNSLRSNLPDHAVGLLKEEMRRMGSLIMEAADATAVPAGRALAVDRTAFSLYIEAKLQAQETLRVIHAEITEIPREGLTIIAAGPLASEALSAAIASLTGRGHLFFYDAISPIVATDSINRDLVFRASRYGGDTEGDYLNCPLSEAQYQSFWEALTGAEEVPLRPFERALYFEGCLPIEVMARRGLRTLAHGPMKPVGLIDPRTGKAPYAVVQLRQEDRGATHYNLVGFQTKLTWPEQRRIFRMIPGLETAEFARYGSIHRNTFLQAPALLEKTLALRGHEGIFFAGQISGVEGYVESAATGLLAGLSAAFAREGQRMPIPPGETALGALLHHLVDTDPGTFQPTNIHFGLMPPPAGKIKKKEKGAWYARRALAALEAWKRSVTPSPPDNTA